MEVKNKFYLREKRSNRQNDAVKWRRKSCRSLIQENDFLSSRTKLNFMSEFFFFLLFTFDSAFFTSLPLQKCSM
jgi:hypothetical protein